VPAPPDGDPRAVRIFAGDPLVAMAHARPLPHPRAFLESLAVEWAYYSQGRGYTAVLDEAGVWRCADDARIAEGLNRFFNPAEYEASVGYFPEGELAAVAYDVARFLGGEYEYVGAEELAPPGEEGVDWVR
jgi:hypothetical protein